MQVNWSELFAFDVPFLEIFVRGTVVYLVLVLMMRFGMNRGAGNIGISDILVVILIADVSQNAMAGDYKSISDGLLLVLTIVFWDYLIDYLALNFKFIEKFLGRREVALVKDGNFLLRNMRREMITKDEIMSQLRLNGVDDIKKVKHACVEANGEISVIKYE